MVWLMQTIMISPPLVAVFPCYGPEGTLEDNTFPYHAMPLPLTLAHKWKVVIKVAY